MISIDNISFEYGPKAIFNHLSLNMPNKGLVTIIGPNGCGKSTLMKLISGDLKPSKGEILIDGLHISDIKVLQLARKLAYCRQNIQSEFPMACLDYILLGRRPFKARFEDYSQADFDMVELMIKKTESSAFIESKLNELSGGERQRINFTKILTQDTPIMIFDESFSAMDLKYRLFCLNVLRELASKKLIITVLHDINLAYLYSNHLIVMKDGKIIKEGCKDILSEDLIKEVYEVEVEFIEEKGFYLGG